MSITIVGAAGGSAYDQSLNTTDGVTFSSVTLPNATQITVGSFDNLTGGANGISLICAVGYELNWQGGRLRNVLVGGDGTPQTIYSDSGIQFPSGGAHNVGMNATGISFADGSSQTTAAPSPYSLPQATGSVLGGVIVGSGLGVSLGTVTVTYGTTSGTACQGNDSRLSDARTPSTHASTHATGGADQIDPVIVTPASLSASQNNYTPGVCDILRLSSSAAIDITGLAAATADGAMRLIINTNASGGSSITLKHESTSSTAANRFRNATGGDYVLSADGGSAVLTYSSAISRWRIL